MATRKTNTARRAVSRRRTSPRKVTKQWSSQEIQFMRKYYRQYETSWIARQLGRTVYSVRYKACTLNIKKANPNVWKGNKGTKNAWNSFSPKGSRPTTSRTTRSRRTTKTGQWKATQRTRQNRRSTPRRKR